MCSHNQGPGWRSSIVASLVVFVSLVVPAMAGAPSVLQAAYERGAFGEVVEAAQATSDAESLALAARASLASARLSSDEPERDASVEKALSLSEAALAHDPTIVEAHIQAAIALGLMGRNLGPVGAHTRKLGKRARRHIDKALQLDPSNPWAHAALGAWHLEIAFGGGPVLGGLFYGAKATEGRSAFDKAIELAPDNLLLRYERALAFLSCAVPQSQVSARKDLQHVSRLEPKTYFEGQIQSRAAELLLALENQETATLARLLVAQRGGYEDIRKFESMQVRMAR